ncbi:MAG: hypothetical protein JNM09_28145 [Blastocatellia bacterium]|nr:hypothetical protein [Blastocatellia bacterium]
MANSNYTLETSSLRTKEFDLVFIEEAVLARYLTAADHTPSPLAAQHTVSTFDQKSLRQFHEEFKALVIAASQEFIEHEEMAWEDTVLKAPIQSDEIEWLQ